jgi:hypothetical protein
MHTELMGTVSASLTGMVTSAQIMVASVILDVENSDAMDLQQLIALHVINSVKIDSDLL